MEERWYQKAARQAVYDAWQTGEAKNPVIEIGTAGGKSVVVGGFCKEMLGAYPDTRIIMATHVQELVAQNYARLLQLWPDAPAGVYSAGLKRKEIGKPITFAGIQSIADKAYNFQACDVMLIDEAHLVPHVGEGQYRRFISDCLSINKHMKIVGLTASPFRLTSGMITDPYRGNPPLFDKIVFSMPYIKLLEEGYVAPLVAKGTDTKVDPSSIPRRGGEFIDKHLASAFDTDDINEAVVDEIVEKGRDRAAWLVFGTSIQHIFHLRDLFRERGISCEAITGNKKVTPDAKRKEWVDEFAAGNIRCLVSVGVLTTGTDLPITDLIALVTATDSPGKLLQIAGRGVRLYPGKQNTLCLDFGGNFSRLGPLDTLSVKKESGAPGKAEKRENPGKECPECHLISPTAVAKCECGYEWPRDIYAKITPTSGDAPILSKDAQPEWLDVTNVWYDSVTTKQTETPMLRANYQLGLGRTVSELVLVEHNGGARMKAEQWWERRDRSGNKCPGQVRAALHLSDDLRRPGRVMVERRGKYWSVLAYDFSVPPRALVVNGEEVA